MTSNAEYVTWNVWGAVHRDDDVDAACDDEDPSEVFDGLDYPSAVALGDFSGAAQEYGLYYAQRWSTSPIEWEIGWRTFDSGTPTSDDPLVEDLAGIQIESIVFDPYSETLFAATATTVYRIESNGVAHEFLTGLDRAAGGLTFTHSGLALVSEEENLIAIDGWRYTFLRGDADANLQLQINDVSRISNWLFLGGPEPACWDSADVNDNSVIDVTDSIYLANALFSGGPAPAAPYPNPGIDPTADLLGCASYAPSQEIDW